MSARLEVNFLPALFRPALPMTGLSRRLAPTPAGSALRWESSHGGAAARWRAPRVVGARPLAECRHLCVARRGMLGMRRRVAAGGARVADGRSGTEPVAPGGVGRQSPVAGLQGSRRAHLRRRPREGCFGMPVGRCPVGRLSARRVRQHARLNADWMFYRVLMFQVDGE